ncbi:MAG: Ger(x)C family spore germination protein [Clostridia bacterium]|nr:Ger(x)C family spore germination protein [Clostridia bacterium]
MKRAWCMVLCLGLTLSLCGCDTEPLKEKLIVEGVAVDFSDQRYRVTLQVYSPLAGSSGKSEYQLFSASGDTVYEALRLIDENTGKRSYYSDTKVVVFSYESLKNGAWNGLEYFIRSSEMSTNVCLAVSMGKADEMFYIEKEGVNMPAQVLSNLLHYGKSDATPFSGELMTVGARLLGQDGDVSLPILQTVQANKKQYPKLNGVLCFREQKPHYAMSERHKWVYNWLQEYYDDRAFVFTFMETPHTLNMKNAKATICATIEQGNPVFHVCLSLECDVMETGTPEGIVLEQVDRFEQMLEQEIEQLVMETVERVFLTEGCDVFNFARTLRKQQPTYYKKLQHWRSIIDTCRITCDVQAVVTRAGQGTVE